MRMPLYKDYLVLWHLEKFWEDWGFGPSKKELWHIYNDTHHDRLSVADAPFLECLDRLRADGLVEWEWQVAGTLKPTRHF